MSSKNKQWIMYIIFGSIIGIFGLFITERILITNLPEAEFHEHANFALFINGDQFDFSKPEFMHLEPCISSNNGLIPTTFAHDDEDGSPDDFIHLHDNNGSTIHIHKAGMQYHDFFEGLEMEFSDTSFTDNQGHTYKNDQQNSWRFFINNKEVPSLANTEARDLDRTLITYGPVNRDQNSINQELIQVPNDACIESGSCKQRGYTAPENCGKPIPEPFILKFLGLTE